MEGDVDAKILLPEDSDNNMITSQSGWRKGYTAYINKKSVKVSEFNNA